MKKILSFVMALCLICTLLPAGILTTSVEAATYAGTFEKYTGTLTDGYYLITYNTYAMKATVSSSRLGYGTITSGAASISDPDASLVWKVTMSGTTATLYNESVSKYAASTGAKNKAQLLASGTDTKSQWTVSGTSAYEFVNVANKAAGVNSNLRNNGTYGFACYATGTGGALTLYKLKDTSEPEEPETPDTPDTPDVSESGYVLADVSTLTTTDKVVIVATKSNGTFAMSNNNGTSSAPSAVAVTVEDGAITSTVENRLLWNVSYSNGSITIYPNGTTATWLYCTATNNGVRVGSTNSNKIFTIDASGYLKHSGTNRYLGVYSAQDWRCYTSSTATNIANQTFAFYKYVEAGTDAPECEHTNTTVLPAEAPSCTEDGKLEGWKCTDCGYEEQDKDPATGHNYEETVKEATCTEAGLKTEICAACGDTVETVIPASHNYVGGTCSVCGAKAPIMFTLGNDGEASHSETTASKTTYSETVSGYTLSITGGEKMYLDSRDAKGNGCIKLGTGDVAGSFQFTVPADVTSVIIAIAGYKANTATVTINGTATALTETSNNGEYRLITVDTSTNKTVSLSVTTGNRAMVNSIEFVVSESEPVAVIGDVKYTTLEEAVEKAAAGDVITLLTDVEIGELDLGDAILDLNGCILTADAVYGNIQDTADEKGMIKIENQDYAQISRADNTQLILWDNTTGATGFRVFDLQFAEAGMNLNNDDTDYAKSFWSDLDFADSRAYQMVASTVSGLNVGFKLEWNGTEKTFWFSEEAQATILKDWGDKKYGNANTELDYFFYVTVTGFVALQEDGVLNVTPVVQDYYGNVIEAGAIEYEFVAG